MFLMLIGLGYFIDFIEFEIFFLWYLSVFLSVGIEDGISWLKFIFWRKEGDENYFKVYLMVIVL